MKAIEKVSVTDLVIKEIKDMCFSGELDIGDKLPTEKELCENLNVGRSTVREALRVLQAMGIIEMRPGKGAYLKTKQGQDESSITQWFKEHEIQLQDFMEIRLSLEPLAVRLAIERGTEEEIEEIEEVFHNFEEAQKKNDAVNMAISDEAFHTAIMKATHNKLLMIISQNIAEAFTEYRTKSFAEKKTAKDALEPHRGIIRAIKDRNVREAQKQMKKHIEISLRDIKRVVEEEE